MQTDDMGKSIALAIFAALPLQASSAHAAVTISAAATANVTCSGGICAPTAKNAVLNVGDLETLLAAGSVTVTTTGTGVQASNIDIKAALSWSSAGTLSLLAKKSVAVDSPVSIVGLSGLTIGTGGKNGTFSFGKKGNVTFANLSSNLSINDLGYILVDTIQTLASDIASNPSGGFALATNYDASQDGTYPSSPIPTVFTGAFEGLGNTISNLRIAGFTNVGGFEFTGLFAEIGAKATLENIGLVDANIAAPKKGKLPSVGSLAARSSGTIMFSHASGAVAGVKESFIGGLVGWNDGTIANSYAAVAVSGKKSDDGGLVGYNTGSVSKSYATGAIFSGGDAIGGLVGENDGDIDGSYATGTLSDGVYSGGLVGLNEATITNSFATGDVIGLSVAGGLVGATGASVGGSAIVSNSYSIGAVSCEPGGNAGGLAGTNGGITAISFSYSTGAVTGGMGSFIGGLVGEDNANAGSITDSYWDTDTSGITNLGQGAGNIANDPGITGLTTAQLQSGLPAGFDPAIWNEKSNIDGGFPYLIANPPAKKK